MTTKFTPDHEYIRVEGSTGIVGITPYAQEQLGDIVFVELPSVGKVLKKGDEAAVVESRQGRLRNLRAGVGHGDRGQRALTGEPGLINQRARDQWLDLQDRHRRRRRAGSACSMPTAMPN